MKRFAPFFALVFLLAGCGDPALDAPERDFVESIFREAGELRGDFAELAMIHEKAERGKNFVSYSYDMANTGRAPLMNPGYFWFKISLGKNAVDPADLQPPVLTAYMPDFGKYLKLRVTTGNAALLQALAGITAERAIKAGGRDLRWGMSGGSSTAGNPRRFNQRRMP